MELSLTQFLTIDGVYQAPGGPEEDTADGFTHGGWSAPFDDQDFGVFTGKKLFTETVRPTGFALTDVRTTSTGVLIANYRADGAPKYGDFSAG